MTKLIHPIIGIHEFEDTQAARILAKYPTAGWKVYKEKEVTQEAKPEDGVKRNKGSIKKSKK